MTNSIFSSPPGAGARISATHVMSADIAGEHALRASRCDACGQAVFPATDVCPFCLGRDCSDMPLAGQGELYSFTRVHVAPKQWETPYALGYADFPCGLRLFAKLARAEAEANVDDWRIGQPVRLVVAPLDGDDVDVQSGPTFSYFLTGATS